jgi:hypothetical protein
MYLGLLSSRCAATKGVGWPLWAATSAPCAWALVCACLRLRLPPFLLAFTCLFTALSSATRTWLAPISGLKAAEPSIT